MVEILRKSISYNEEWIDKYQNLSLSDMEVKDTLGVGAFGRVDLVTISSIPDKSFARKKIRKTKVIEYECDNYILNEKKIMKFCDSPFICK